MVFTRLRGVKAKLLLNMNKDSQRNNVAAERELYVAGNKKMKFLFRAFIHDLIFSITVYQRKNV